jgi:hypothetical protein
MIWPLVLKIQVNPRPEPKILGFEAVKKGHIRNWLAKKKTPFRIELPFFHLCTRLPMRFLTAALLVFFFVAPAWAQSASQQGGVHNFGRITCPQPIPCPDEAAALSASALASTASACFTQYFGYSSPSGFFDDMNGLDNNQCLTPLPNALQKGMGGQLVPACCVVKSSSGNCAFRCELNTP